MDLGGEFLELGTKINSHLNGPSGEKFKNVFNEFLTIKLGKKIDTVTSAKLNTLKGDLADLADNYASLKTKFSSDGKLIAGLEESFEEYISKSSSNQKLSRIQFLLKNPDVYKKAFSYGFLKAGKNIRKVGNAIAHLSAENKEKALKLLAEARDGDWKAGERFVKLITQGEQEGRNLSKNKFMTFLETTQGQDVLLKLFPGKSINQLPINKFVQRFVDSFDDGFAHEIKSYKSGKVNGSKEILFQVLKDIALMNSTPGYKPVWHILGNKGVTLPFMKKLEEVGIPFLKYVN